MKTDGEYYVELIKQKKRNQEAFYYFKNKVNYYYYKVFQLTQYDLIIDVDETEPRCQANYYCESDTNGKNSIHIAICRDYLLEKPTEEQLDKLAFHSVSEALLLRLSFLAVERFVTEREIENAITEIVRTLDNVIYPMVKKENCND